jgi:hypothetical protein
VKNQASRSDCAGAPSGYDGRSAESGWPLDDPYPREEPAMPTASARPLWSRGCGPATTSRSSSRARQPTPTPSSPSARTPVAPDAERNILGLGQSRISGVVSALLPGLVTSGDRAPIACRPPTIDHDACRDSPFGSTGQSIDKAGSAPGGMLCRPLLIAESIRGYATLPPSSNSTDSRAEERGD